MIEHARSLIIHRWQRTVSKKLNPCRYPDLIYSKLVLIGCKVVSATAAVLIMLWNGWSTLQTWLYFATFQAPCQHGLDFSDPYFFIGFNCGSKILSQSIIQDQRSPTNYQWSNLHNQKPWFRKFTHSVEERMEHSTPSVCECENV